MGCDGFKAVTASGANSIFHLYGIPLEGDPVGDLGKSDNSIHLSIAPSPSAVGGSQITNSSALHTGNPREDPTNGFNASGGTALHRP